MRNDFESNYLMHHGILGMKWGVRRYQNPDGTLTDIGRARLAKKVGKLERKAINATYKESRKNGGSFVFKSARRSTGKNFDKAEKDFEKKVLNDSNYKKLSKNAFDAEKKRLMAEKNYTDYDKMYSSKEYKKLDKESQNATEKKDAYVKKMAKDYVSSIKDAKIKDLNLSEEDSKLAKEFISSNFDSYIWDGNLEYNPDHYYEKWVDKEKYKEKK